MSEQSKAPIIYAKHEGAAGINRTKQLRRPDRDFSPIPEAAAQELGKRH